MQLDGTTSNRGPGALLFPRRRRLFRCSRVETVTKETERRECRIMKVMGSGLCGGWGCRKQSPTHHLSSNITFFIFLMPVHMSVFLYLILSFFFLYLGCKTLVLKQFWFRWHTTYRKPRTPVTTFPPHP